MNMKKVLATVAVASMLVGCGGGGNSGGGNTGAALKEGDTVKIGYIGPLTGQYSAYGIPVKESIALAIKDYNASADAKYKFELLAEDAAGKEDQATSAYNKLVGDGVVGIVGPVMTGEALAVGNASAKNLTPIVSSSASGDTVTSDAKGVTRPNFFRTCSNDSKGGQFIAQKAADGTVPNVKKVAVLTCKDSDYSLGCTDSFVKQAEKDKLQIVDKESYPATEKNFATYIDKALAAGADTIYIPDYYETISMIVKQFRDKGFNGTFLGTDGWDGVLSVKDVDKTMFNNAYYTNIFKDDSEPVQNYVKAYKEANQGKETNMFGTMAYDATFVLIKAVEKAGTTDAKAVCEALKATNYEGITGVFQFDEKNTPTKDLIIKTIKDGAYSYLD